MLGLMQQQPLLVSSFIRHAARNHGAVEVVSRIGEDTIHRTTYAEVEQRARVLANALQRLGVKHGDRVATLAWNSYRHLELYYAISGIGAVCHTVNPRLALDDIAYIVNHAEDVVLFADTGLAGLVTALAPLVRDTVRTVVMMTDAATMPEVTVAPGMNLGCYETLMAEADAADAWPEFDENTAAALCYTSGTTGRPKGAMLSHGNLLHNVESCRQVLQYANDDRMAVLLPMFHSFMLCVGVFLPMLMGGSIVLIRSLHPPRNVLLEITLRKATILPAIPQFFRSMTAATLTTPLPLRMAISGAAPLPVQILTEFSQKFPFPLIEGYGLSEASPVVTKNPLKGVRKAGSIGLPIPNVEVSIQDDDGRMLETGEIGELCVRGGNVMMGYWNQPEETAKALRGGWLLTGDIGYRDADGYYFITDRKKDMLLVNGINVYPREVEETLYQFPGVKEASVIGVPDARKGEQPLAFVVANEGTALEEKAILQFVRSKLADYKAPRRVVFLEALPRNATGKVVKTALREMAGKGMAMAEQAD